MARNSSTSAASRHRRDELALREFMAADTVSSLNELQDKLRTSVLPDGLLIQKIGPTMLLYFIDFGQFPIISASMVVNSDLSWSAWLAQQLIPKQQMPLIGDQIETVSSLTNSMAQLKAMCVGNVPVNGMAVYKYAWPYKTYVDCLVSNC